MNIKRPMPMIHHARRSWRNRLEGNAFATDAVILQHIEELTNAYLRTESERLGRALKIEIDRLETLI